MEVVISASVANYNGLTNQQFFQYINEKANKVEFYRFQPTPGQVYAASSDWKVVTKISSVLSIASFIWMAYNELVKPNKEPESNSGIIIRIENLEEHNHFWIGNEINDKEELLRLIQNTLESNKIDSLKTIEEINLLKNSSHWKKVN